jgi:hypothetical protein
MDLRPPSMDEQALPRVYELTSPALAFEVGLGAAFEATYAEQHPELVQSLYRQDLPSPADRDRLYRCMLVPSNGLIRRFEGETPTDTLRTPDEARRTPGVVATFMYRLLRRTGSHYPQRFLLWVYSYEGEERPYAKVMLALSRMPRREELSLATFIQSYIETFPAERAAVLSLAQEVLGQ